MNKTAIKNFAIWARNKLIADISYRAGLMGITADGIHAALPQSTGQTEFYDIGTAEPYAITGEAIRQRKHLVELIQRKEKDTDYKTAYKYIIEEVAYTWFNRLIAVRFMEVNDYLPSHIRVLSSDTGKLEPDLVTTPFDAELEFTRDEQQTVLDLKNSNKLDDLFRLLFIKQCNALNEILPALFEKTNDYTELLLNLSVIDQDGVVYHLVHDIPEEDFNVERGGQVEIIGWLYQYYNIEPKNEAFRKKENFTKEEIAPATQLFTPDWIVRYMVENSLGRLWVEGHPHTSLKNDWEYYLEETEQEPEVQKKLAEIHSEYATLNPEDIRVIDPCMGSGHILVYAFDILMRIYESAGYGQRDAARRILENNLYGLDIDDRAFQLAYFAVLMKARQYNRRILTEGHGSNICTIRESNDIDKNQLKYFGEGLSEEKKQTSISQINYLLDKFQDAKVYGSILTVNQCDWELLAQFTSNIKPIGQLSFDAIGIDETKEALNAIIMQGKILAQEYSITVTNPPYMGAGNMPQLLSEYVKNNYPESKADMFAVFVERCDQFTKEMGFQAMITQQTCLFIPSFEKLRKKIYSNTITNLIQVGFNSFPEMNSKVALAASFVIRKAGLKGYRGTYFDLSRNFPRSADKQEVFQVVKDNQSNKYFVDEAVFLKIPGAPVAYWISENLIEAFSGKSIKDYGFAGIGMRTGDNQLFLRLWHEVSKDNTIIGCNSREEQISSLKRWVPYNKGGDFRKWYGNNSYVVNWFNDGEEIKENTRKNYPYLGDDLGWKISNENYYYKKGITWSGVSMDTFSCRCYDEGFIFDSGANGLFSYDPEDRYYLAGVLNSCVGNEIIKILNPTINTGSGTVNQVPIIMDTKHKAEIINIVKACIELTKKDWDSFELSWNYSGHPLVGRRTHFIAEAYSEWKTESENRYKKLKKNEERLNEIFIELYGLSGIMAPEVEESEVSIRKADINRDIRSLISYAVGCMFGRYSLDRKGLVLAGENISADNYALFVPDSDNVIPVTDEEYLEDDIVSRLCTWLKVVYGENTLEENLDFLAKVLGNKGNSSREIIRNYFLNDFYKDHCQLYSVTGSGKRPIYWLFDSGKQNGFKALIYLHRYNADTIGNLRIDYLHRMQRVYESEIGRMQDMIDHSTNAREVAQATKRREKLTKQLKECREYDEKLAHLALSRIELDLDDGVKVNYRKIQTANDGKFYEVLADSKNIMVKK